MRSQKFSRRIYSLLLRLYPRKFYRAYSSQIAQVFQDGCRAAYRKGGVPDLLRFWGSALLDLSLNIPAEWIFSFTQGAYRMNSAKTVELSIVLPIYNEASQLNSLIQGLTSALNGFAQSWELVVVNDGSRDDSAQILDGLRSDQIKIMHLNHNVGIKNAVRSGVLAAQGKIIYVVDANHLDDDSAFEEALKGAKDVHLSLRPGFIRRFFHFHQRLPGLYRVQLDS